MSLPRCSLQRACGHRLRAVPLRELAGAVLPEDERDVAEPGRSGIPESSMEVDLPRRRGEKIRAPPDVGDSHGEVVDDVLILAQQGGSDL